MILLTLQNVNKAFVMNEVLKDVSLTLQAGTDGLHAENSDDGALGYVYIGGGSLEELLLRI